MKKLKLIFAVLLCTILVGCTSNETKTVATKDSVNNTLVENGYAVVDNMKIYDGAYVKNAIKGSYGDITIEFIEYTSSENAETVLKGHIDTFKLLKSTGAAEKNIEGKNFHHYTLISNNYFMISARVENTLVFCKTPLTNKDKVEAVFNTINY